MKSKLFIHTALVFVLSATATLSAGQPIPLQTQNKLGNSMADAQHLLRYLRCDEVPLNRFGEAEAPEQSLMLLVERSRASDPRSAEEKERADEMPQITLEVWPGLQAQLQVLAGYGFFGIVQFYRKEDKPALLKNLAAAGWKLQRMPNRESVSRIPAMALVPVYQGSQPMGDIERNLTFMEAHVDEMTAEVDLNGLTVVCSYGKKKK